MRIFCSICKDIFIPHSEVFVTNCGHLYHGVCIKTWIERHRTCPQCRASLSKPFRVYFDVEKDDNKDPSTLEHELENVSDKLREVEKQKQTLLEEQKKSEELNEKLKERSEQLKKRNGVLRTSITALKEQIIKLSQKNKAIDRLESELAESKAKTSILQKVENLIKCSADEVNKMLEATPITALAIKQLCTYVGVLKLQLDKYHTKNLALSKQINEFNSKANEERLKYTSEANETIRNLQLRNAILEKEVVCFKALQSKCTIKGLENNEHPSSSSSTKTQGKKSLMDLLDLDFSDDDEDKSKRSGPADKLINNWEEFVCAGPSKNIAGGLKKSRSFSASLNRSLNSVKNITGFRCEESYAFDGLGGRKKIRLGGPTPAEEFEKIKKKKEKKLGPTFQHKKIIEYYQLD